MLTSCIYKDQCDLKDNFNSVGQNNPWIRVFYCKSTHHLTMSPLSLSLSEPFVRPSGDVWHHPRWEPAGGRMWAYGWLPGGLLEKHSPHQLQPTQPTGNEAAHGCPALQPGPGLRRAGNKCWLNSGWGYLKRRGQEVIKGERLKGERLREGICIKWGLGSVPIWYLWGIKC